MMGPEEEPVTASVEPPQGWSVPSGSRAYSLLPAALVIWPTSHLAPRPYSPRAKSGAAGWKAYRFWRSNSGATACAEAVTVRTSPASGSLTASGTVNDLWVWGMEASATAATVG